MVTNRDAVIALERIADLLEIRGDNSFKVRAYRQAALQVENLGRELADIQQDEGGLESIEGFGPAIAQKIGELVSTGRLPYLEGLEEEIPSGVVDMRRLAGVGPRTAASLWHEAGITSIDQLEAALSSGALATMPRMGTRTLEKIAAAITEWRLARPARRPREELAPLVATLREVVSAVPGTTRVEVAGSYRRGLPTVKDLDIVAATTAPEGVLRAVTTLPDVERIVGSGTTRCSVIVEGVQVDCRAVTVEQFGAVWQYFTGSQAHNVRLRARALRRGLTLNEYGVFRLEDGERIAGATEEEVYESLGLNWIPPELREDRGEIDAAEAGAGAAAVLEEVR
jgi:DNA polymerase (family 10)